MLTNNSTGKSTAIPPSNRAVRYELALSPKGLVVNSVTSIAAGPWRSWASVRPVMTTRASGPARAVSSIMPTNLPHRPPRSLAGVDSISLCRAGEVNCPEFNGGC